MAQNSLTKEMIAASNVIIEPGDLFYVRSYTLLGRAIRFLTRKIGEPPTKTNHVGVFTEFGRLRDVKCIEASYSTKYHPFWDSYYGNKVDVAVYSCNYLPYDTRKLLAEEALKFQGKTYGYFKLLLHFGDFLLLGANVFRRLSFIDRFPICSYLAAHAYAETLGYRFGLRPESASPDDMLDWTERHPAKWTCKLPWTRF